MTITLGELFSNRKLKQDTLGGVARYEPGQYAAKVVSKEDAVLSYVDSGGGVCIIPCEFKNGEWFHRGVIFRVTMDSAQVRPLPRSFALTDLMVRALQKKSTAPQQTT